MPLFFWLLDTAIINSYLILKNSGENISRKEFQIKLIWDLIKSGIEDKDINPANKNQYITEKSELSSSEGHFPEW
ncbi:hypothetical protein Glove_406g93 [Diversispora epigaea]|uniref:Uncharacterized protein n=1 Tax=Diversispora epigaea TaxID=1348612 RepID=A0A397H3B5_9GLOM|nr:hypothetical protein Glove_406g93 [Diversispora epigaea]